MPHKIMNAPLVLFPWNSNFETGISSIDTQHQTLVNIINELAQHLASGSNDFMLNHIFTKLTDYAVYHFDSEESIWKEFLPAHLDSIQHAQVHQDFIAMVTQYQNNAADSSLNEMIEELLAYLIHWLIDHILESDMHLAKIVIALQEGYSLKEAESKADYQMTNVLHTMIETTREMYNNLTQLTLALMKEKHSRCMAEKKLELAAKALNNTLESICITDKDKQILSANPAFYKAIGYVEDEVIGKALSEFKSGLSQPSLIEDIQKNLEQCQYWSGELNSRNKVGELIIEWLSVSTVCYQQHIENYVYIFSNISSLVKNQKKLEQIAHHDALTGLPNRLLLTDRFYSAISQAKRHHYHLFKTCYLDLDGFKPINDTYSHAAGDLVLCTIAQRILETLRDIDTISRIGGDEFIILLSNVNNGHDCLHTLQRLLDAISKPITLKSGAIVSVTASIGVACYPQHGTDMETLLLNADKAMYLAKQRGKSQFVLYDADNDL